MSTIVKYHGDKELDRNGRIWQLHNNNFEKDTVAAGIKKHYLEPENLSIEDYLLYAGLCQGLMYGYSLEAMRFKQNCGGALFWMYNDCWGEVGWTIIDYYLKRKISYYFVKKAFAPVKLVLREVEGVVKVLGINDTAQTLDFEIEYNIP
jgi:beta-mannosidase